MGNLQGLTLECRPVTSPSGKCEPSVINAGNGADFSSFMCTCCSDDCNAKACTGEPAGNAASETATSTTAAPATTPAGPVRIPGNVYIPTFSCLSGMASFVASPPGSMLDAKAAAYLQAMQAGIPVPSPVVNATNCTQCRVRLFLC